ncbi:MAG: T9SS type A sorting domain-containing protein [Saprospiraceae bacterium]|nr:T9SS type A sorting domain-containing protein [Saprospiraceae bacterium]
MKKHTFTLLLSLLALLPMRIDAQFDLTMQAWYWDYFTGPNFGNWCTQLNTKVDGLEAAGFKHIWLPPLSRTSTPNNYTNGYNPMDLYDLGQYGAECAWGSRAELNTLVSNLNSRGMDAVSDMIYNHRDGGKPEKNPAVKTFITNTSNSSVFPSDRFFCMIPLGSANFGNNGAGDYYVKVESKSHNYGAFEYKFYARTNNSGNYIGSVIESEPNGGAFCVANPQPSQVYNFGYDVEATLYDWDGCWIDEYKITLNSGNFNATDDTLFIYMSPTYNSCPGGNCYSDHYIKEVYSAPRNANIVNEVEYWTYTNFNGMPSGQGGMNYSAFRPNDNTANTENLSCPENCMLFFYDYDQSQTSAINGLNAWTNWQLTPAASGGVGIGGLRLDAVKHFPASFVGQLMNYLDQQNHEPDMMVGEFFDYSATALNDWVNAVYSSMNPGNPIKIKAFDFALRDALRNSCNYGNDTRNIYHSGMVDGAGGSGYNVVTFIDNHDLRHSGLNITQKTNLAYAYIMTNNRIGAPCIFYPDYYGIQVGSAPLINLQSEINALSALHQTYILGSADYRYLNDYGSSFTQWPVGSEGSTLVYQLAPNSSGKNVIVAINFGGPIDIYQKIYTTGWGTPNGTYYRDELGNSDFYLQQVTNNEIRNKLPAASYTVFVESDAAAPVELKDFTAVPENNDVRLKWQVETEKSFSHYDIERSSGDAFHFEKIGRVQATGDQSAYQWLDKKPPVNTTLFYRLNMTDADGTSAYSPVRQVEIEDKNLIFNILPNPGKHAVLEITSTTAHDFQVQISDVQGRIVWEQNLNSDHDATIRQALPTDLNDGIYMVRITWPGGQKTLRWSRPRSR